DEHLEHIDTVLDYYQAHGATKCRLFVLTRKGAAMTWFKGLEDDSIDSWRELCRAFSSHFTERKRQPKTMVSLSNIIQGKEESLRNYIERKNRPQRTTGDAGPTYEKGKYDPPRRNPRRSESPKRKRSPKKESPPKKRVEMIKDKGTDNNEEGRDPGKRPFVAAIIGGFTKSLSSPTTDKQKGKEAERKSLTTASITGGPSNPKGRSGGTTKRRIAEMCSVITDTTSSREGGRPILGFNDDEYPGGTPNEIFPLIVIATMAHHDVSRILIDQGSSCDVMYQELFEKFGLKKEDLCTYEGTDLQGFNRSTICPWGLINLPVTFESKESKHSR
ncbi:hypothetical protein A2U01_0019018, partial [Trifolium medium]|nr:hypothetical protein [Trifolium medium]